MQAAIRSIIAGAGRKCSNSLLDVYMQRSNTLPQTLPLFRGMASKGKSDCIEEEALERKGMSCRRPDLRKKPIPPYQYGYCREPDVPMMMSCPPKGKKGNKGPCCHDEGPQKTGGCRTSK